MYCEELTSGYLIHEFRYDYSLLELYDQVAREESGGELGNLWSFGNISDLDFVIARGGKEAEVRIKTQGLYECPQVLNLKKIQQYVLTIKGLCKVFNRV